jgi:uncharacterized protein
VFDEVCEILNLYRAINSSQLKHGIDTSDYRSKFRGFDGNSSDGYFTAAKFLRRTEGKWDELKDCPDNCHSAGVLDGYREMVRRWKTIGQSHDITPEQVEYLMNQRGEAG